MKRARDPSVVPPHVVQYSITLDVDAPGNPAELFPGICLPVELQAAARSRQLSFLAGRHCAREAISRLWADRAGTEVRRTVGGAPQWPEGIVGSITHTDGFMSAAVALTRDVSGVGIDSERIVTEKVAGEIANLIMTPKELALAIEGIGMSQRVGLTVGFSVKEAIFKCLYPVVRRHFDYFDAELCEIDVAGRRFFAVLKVSLAEDLPRGMRLVGGFEVGSALVHSGMALGRRSPGAHSADAY